jgi:hypothetical protein
MNEPRIKLWDLETGFNLIAAFSLFNKHAPIPYKNIQQERYIICGGFKDLGKAGVRTYKITDYKGRFKKSPTDDYDVVKAIHAELSDSDAVIAHNGDNFDMKYFNTRCLLHGFGPAPKIVQIDTLKMARKLFNFNSNRLDYLAQFLGLGHKVNIGHEVWLDAFRGDVAAVEKIAKYNVVDVKLLEQVYVRLAPYDVAQVNRGLWAGGALVCPLCGSEHVQSKGWRITRTRRYRRMRCKECGHPFQDVRADPYSIAQVK